MLDPTTSDTGGGTATASDRLVIFAGFDPPPNLPADMFDIRPLSWKPNGHIPQDLAGQKIWLWPLDDDASRKQAGIIASALMSGPAPASCHIIAAEPPWDAAAMYTALKDAKPIERAIQAVKSKRPMPQPDPELEAAYILWERFGLSRVDNGPPHATADNVSKALLHHPLFEGDVVWYDEFRERVMTTWKSPDGDAREWSDDDDACLLVQFQRGLKWPKLSMAPLRDGFQAYLQGKRRNPLTEWLDGLVWDGTERLPAFLADTYGCPRDAYHDAVGRCWLVSMVARAYRPGCQVDTIPVLEGGQGIRKTTSLEVLGGEFYVALPRGFGDVDFLQVMEGCWLGEIPDMASFKGRDLDHIKAFITIREDRYRKSYARRAISRKRQCVFAASDNAGNWNTDPTGARRFWPFACQTVNMDYLNANRDQLFAEARIRFERGESWWDVPEDEQKEQVSLRELTDEWQQVIEQFITHNPRRMDGSLYWEPRHSPMPEVTVTAILEEALNIPIERWDQRAQNRVASIMKRLLWQRSRRRDGDRRYWAYVPDNSRLGPGPTLAPKKPF